jgi:methylated-DNA-protein-cysteine methyltransferase-like protein
LDRYVILNFSRAAYSEIVQRKLNEPRDAKPANDGELETGDWRLMGYFEDIRRVVRKIPRGKVATYGSVARAAGHPGTARQVSWALRAAEATRVPWHRVLGADGRILLPGEAGLRQRTLLELEGVQFKGNRVNMKRFEWPPTNR